MVNALREAGLAVLATSHEHNYQRGAPDDRGRRARVHRLGRGGQPLPPDRDGAEAGRIFSLYQVPGGVFKPENVVTAVVFNYVHMRLWYGGGEFFTYAVDKYGKDQLIDHVQIDLKRFGTPEIDQNKMPIPPPADRSNPARPRPRTCRPRRPTRPRASSPSPSLRRRRPRFVPSSLFPSRRRIRRGDPAADEVDSVKTP
jgi:hypothetical protein